jgi:hypothetical protein
VGVGVADDGDALDVAELVELVLQLLLRRLPNRSIEILEIGYVREGRSLSERLGG